MTPKEYSTALPDSNQKKVLGDYQVMARGPRWAEMKLDSRTEKVAVNGDTGVVPLGPTQIAVGPQSVKISTEFLHDSSVDSPKQNSL